MALPLNGHPHPIPNAPGGQTPATLSGQGQGYCSFDILPGPPSVIGYGGDPGVQQQQGSMVGATGEPYVAPNQQSPNANPNRGGL